MDDNKKYFIMPRLTADEIVIVDSSKPCEIKYNQPS